MSDEKLKELHGVLANKLLERVKDPEVKSSDLNVARQFLKDHTVRNFEKKHGADAKKLNWKGKVNWNTRPHRPGEIYYLSSKNPQDFRFDLRELYAAFSGNNYDFKIGKQIHSWGNVDDNCPIDNGSAIDYNAFSAVYASLIKVSLTLITNTESGR